MPDLKVGLLFVSASHRHLQKALKVGTRALIFVQGSWLLSCPALYEASPLFLRCFGLLSLRAISPGLSVTSLPFRRGSRPLFSHAFSPGLSAASLPFRRGSRPLSSHAVSPDLSVASLLSVPCSYRVLIIPRLRLTQTMTHVP